MTEDPKTAQWAQKGPKQPPRFTVPRRGEVFADQYKVLGPLGEGGMGVVLRCQDQRLEREVAVKLIRPDHVAERSARERFVREARAMARVQHPNVVEIYTFGESDGVPYFVMEYVPGQDLYHWMTARGGPPVAVDEAIGIMDQVCKGVQAIHQQGAIHHDLKPSNILIGPAFRVAITDLGLTRFLEGMGPNSSGPPLGTPEFTAPEIVLGQKVGPDLASRVDVYALGIVAYQLLTGAYVFQSEDTVELLRKHAKEPPVPPSELREELPPALDIPILAALEKDPAKRIPTPEAFREALSAARGRVHKDSKAGGLRIVIADDDPNHLRWVGSVLGHAFEDAEIVSTNDGREALHEIRSHLPSLLVTDLQMPELNGVELTAALRGRPATKLLPIIVMTAVGGAPDWKMLQKMGADGFLVKPFAHESLTALARKLIAERQRRTI